LPWLLATYLSRAGDDDASTIVKDSFLLFGDMMSLIVSKFYFDKSIEICPFKGFASRK